MNDFHERFILDCRLICSEQEYADKKRLLQHNQAMARLTKLQREMFAEKDHCCSLAYELLSHNEEKVRLIAGSYCLMARIHQEKAMQTLLAIEETSQDKMLSASAFSSLKYCKPFDTQG